jgi:hypothetical protein
MSAAALEKIFEFFLKERCPRCSAEGRLASAARGNDSSAIATLQRPSPRFRGPSQHFIARRNDPPAVGTIRRPSERSAGRRNDPPAVATIRRPSERFAWASERFGWRGRDSLGAGGRTVNSPFKM